MKCTIVGAGHSGLMPADLTTLPHLSVSFATIFPNVSGDPPVPVTPSSASRVFNLESSRIALISLLSLSTIWIGVFPGALMPYQTLAS